MNVLKLNFSKIKKRKQQRSNLFVLIVLLLLALGILFEYNRMENRAIDIEDTIARSQGRKPIKQAKPTDHDLRQMKISAIVQEKLNFPWQELLVAIELVKHESVTVSLMTIQPNPSKKEVLIKAKVPNLEAMLAFISSLEQQAMLHDVLLINQHLVDPTKNKMLEFSLKMGWKV